MAQLTKILGSESIERRAIERQRSELAREVAGQQRAVLLCDRGQRHDRAGGDRAVGGEVAAPAGVGAAGLGLELNVVAIVVAAATPIAPPICWLVLIRPDAIPASDPETPVSPAIVIGTKVKASPTALNRKAGKRSKK